MTETGIAIAGLGTVGMGVVANLQRNSKLIATRLSLIHISEPTRH